MNGRIAWWNKEKGYGFIASSDYDVEVFAHGSHVRAGVGEPPGKVTNLRQGQEVTFDIEVTDRGPQARNIQANNEDLPITQQRIAYLTEQLVEAIFEEVQRQLVTTR